MTDFIGTLDLVVTSKIYFSRLRPVAAVCKSGIADCQVMFVKSDRIIYLGHFYTFKFLWICLFRCIAKQKWKSLFRSAAVHVSVRVSVCEL
jgi:hypothetical protein